MLSPNDQKILELMQQNCRMPIREISQSLKIPVTTVHNRVKKMERSGIITGYVTIVDSKKLGKNIRAILQISLVYGRAERPGQAVRLHAELVGRHNVRLPEVEFAEHVLGAR